MLRTLLFAVFICCSLTVVAQPLTLSNKFAIKVTPSSLMDMEARQVPVGVEYLFNKYWGVGIQASIPLLSTVELFQGSEPKITSDMKYRLEGRRYFRTKKNTSFFVGLEAYTRNMRLEAFDGIYLYDNDDREAYSSVTIHRLEWGAGAFVGTVNRISGNLFFDWHIGYGLKHAQATASDLVKKEIGPRDWGRAGLDQPKMYEVTEGRSATRPQVLLALRLSYMIGLKK